TASTAILISAAFFRTAPRRCGISISSTWLRVSELRASANIDQSAYARRDTTRPRSARALLIGSKSNSPVAPASRAPMARFSKSTNRAIRSSSIRRRLPVAVDRWLPASPSLYPAGMTHPLIQESIDRRPHVRDLLAMDTDDYTAVRDLWKAHSLAEDARDIPGLMATLTDDCVYE